MKKKIDKTDKSKLGFILKKILKNFINKFPKTEIPYSIGNFE